MKSILRRKQTQAIAALVMAIAVLATLVGLGLSTGRAGAASASHAQKVPLTQTNRDCSGTVIGLPQTETFGFAIINQTGAGKLIANVVLVNATPNATYNIRLIQTPNTGPVPGSDCLIVDGTLTTDALGNGNTNVQEPVLAGVTGVWVDLNNQADFTNFFDTQVVPLSDF